MSNFIRENRKKSHIMLWVWLGSFGLLWLLLCYFVGIFEMIKAYGIMPSIVLVILISFVLTFPFYFLWQRNKRIDARIDYLFDSLNQNINKPYSTIRNIMNELYSLGEYKYKDVSLYNPLYAIDKIKDNLKRFSILFGNDYTIKLVKHILTSVEGVSFALIYPENPYSVVVEITNETYMNEVMESVEKQLNNYFKS